MFLIARFTLLISIVSITCMPQSKVYAKAQDQEEESLLSALPSETAFEDRIQSDLIFDSIAQENLRTLTQLDSKKASAARQEYKHKKWHESLLDSLQEHLHLPFKAKRRLIFMLFAQYEQMHAFPESTVLDATSWKDLELLCGPKSDVTYYVGLKIDRTQTEAGRAIFFKKLITPTNNPDILLRNQKIIRELYENQELFDRLEKEILTLKKTESIILSFWHEDVFHDSLKQDALNIPYAKNASTYINKTPALVEMAAYTKLVSTIGANVTMLAAAVFLPVIGIATLTDSDKHPAIVKISEQVQKKGLHVASLLSLFGLIFQGLNALYPESKGIKGAEGLIVGPTTAFPALFFPDYMRYIVTFRTSLQTKLMYVAHYINALNNIARIVKSCPALEDYCSTAGDLEQQMLALATSSDDAAQFFSILKTNTFKGRPSFFSWYGRVNVAYQLLHKIKDGLVEPMMTVGELDAYLSCVRFMKEMHVKNIPVCFAEYITAQTPQLSIVNFWNPSLSGTKAITNSIEIGHNGPKNIIVTGPNAGGKSTTMKGLLLNIVLAQTFGIATASSLVFTPFAKIITYLNITDDIAAGKSHFKAGASRARELIKTADCLSWPHFSLTAVDEVFDGTTFYEGQAAAYALIEQLSNFNTNMCITITHFPKVPLLEKEHSDRFANYKVTASFNAHGDITYPYKIERGISTQNIAFDILKREGFNDTFINKAEEILSEHNSKKDS